jgi:hypothetical protein
MAKVICCQRRRRAWARASLEVGCPLAYPAAARTGMAAPRAAPRATPEKSASRTGVERVMATSLHWRWPSIPRWACACSKVVSLARAGHEGGHDRLCLLGSGPWRAAPAGRSGRWRRAATPNPRPPATSRRATTRPSHDGEFQGALGLSHLAIPGQDRPWPARFRVGQPFDEGGQPPSLDPRPAKLLRATRSGAGARRGRRLAAGG